MFPPAALRVACRAARTLAKVAFVLAAGTAAAADETTLRVATTLPNFVEQFDPNKSFLSTHDIVLSPTFDKLMSFDRAGRPRMLAARSVAYSADGMSVDVKLRDDGFWSYGERVVAEDFARGLRRSALADSDSNHLMVGVRNSEKWAAGDYSAPLGIEALDADTLVIRLNAPFGYDLTNLMNMQANPYPPPGREGKPIASNGPYMIATMENERVTLARNPYYRRERPYFDRIEFIGFAHDVAVDYFISGKADVLIGPLGKQKKWLVERYKNNAIEIGLPRSYVLVLAAQTQNTPAPLKDAEFRRALFAALDHVAFENTDMFFKSNKHCGLIPAAIPCSDERKRI